MEASPQDPDEPLQVLRLYRWYTYRPLATATAAQKKNYRQNSLITFSMIRGSVVEMMERLKSHTYDNDQEDPTVL